MVVAEESEDGAHARLRILDLDPATGNYLGILHEYDEEDGVLGFENAVDPLIIAQRAPVGGYLIVVPVEDEAGTDAAIVMLLTDALGAVVPGGEAEIHLGDLGFRADVDPVSPNTPWGQIWDRLRGAGKRGWLRARRSGH